MVLLTLCGAAVWPTAQSRAQGAYPSRPIQVVVTTAAGGALDLVARTTTERLAEALQQPLIIENQPAGNGTVAAGQFAKAAPDGQTLMMVVDSTVTINPHLYNNIAYDPFRDFAPVSMITRLPLVLVGRPGLQARDLRELMSLAKANPGKLSYASTGVGTILHIGMELFKLRSGTDILHVPYRATTTAMADILGDRVDLVLVGLSSAKANIEAGKLRAYAVAAPQRSSLLPNVPTMHEAGLPGAEMTSWFGMFAPAKTPAAILQRLSQEIRNASAHPKFIAALAPQGMQIVASSPEEMLQAMREDSAKWGDVIRQTGTTIAQ
jgi:tripartite-type tricarboxylate transporter receptor subunit TctC